MVLLNTGEHYMATSLYKVKFQLLAEGMSISNSARNQLINSSSVGAMTLADYASTSGIPICLPGLIWVNAPIVDCNPNFVNKTQYQLDWADDDFVLRSSEDEWSVSPAPVPGYAALTNSQGELYSHFGLTHTDRVRISPIAGCANNCIFCDLPHSCEYRLKDVEMLLEVVHVAMSDPVLPARHVLISGGTPKVKDYGYLKMVYEAVLGEFSHVPVDIMMIPIPAVLDLNDLYKQGLNGLSINLELFDDEFRRRMIPEKNAIPKDDWLSFISKAVETFGKEVRSMLMVGLEPIEKSIDGVRALAERGCTPVLSPFRPAPGTPLQNIPSPSAEFFEEVYLRACEVCDINNIELGPQCIPCQHNTLSFPRI